MQGDAAGRLARRPVAESLDELLGGADRREPFDPLDRRSSARFERVWIDGRPHVVKYLHLDDDFAMRAFGDIGCCVVRAWAAGLLDVAPEAIDHATLGVARNVGRNGWGAAVLMRDVSSELLPPGDDAMTAAEHDTFIDHLGRLCAATWGWKDDVGLMPYEQRWSFFGSAMVEAERSLGWPERVPAIAADGWERFAERAPARVAVAVDELRHDPLPLAAALSGTPSCFLHGDWKAGNLGTGRDGRTILLDWMYLGEGPACHELGWYLALNRAKLPHGRTKEHVIEEFRAALERHGVSTDQWWDRQLRLALLGTVVQFGWEKALGDDDELGWWCARAADGLELL